MFEHEACTANLYMLSFNEFLLRASTIERDIDIIQLN